MIHRVLKIGPWVVDFLFCTRRYDIDGVLACLRDAGAPKWVRGQALDLMENCDYNCGFTYSVNEPQRYSYANPGKHRAVVLIGPTSSGEEFLDTLVHEIHHLAVAIARSKDADLTGETPAYISGDTVREFADVICELGCRRS